MKLFLRLAKILNPRCVDKNDERKRSERHETLLYTP